MMEWYKIISYFATNEIRLILGLYLVMKLLNFSKQNKKVALLSVVSSIFITILTVFSLPQFYLIGIEVTILVIVAYYLFREEIRMCLFLIFFYEIGIALWEFLISAWFGIMFHNSHFIDEKTTEYIIAVWVVRFLMVGVLLLINLRISIEKEVTRFVSIIAVVGMFGVITLSGQKSIPLSDDQLTTWTILSLLLLLSVLFFNLNRQYEMEKEIARLKEEKLELLENDYMTLNKIHTANARLYHDIHNHIEVMYRYLEQGKINTVIQYLKDLRTPVQEITQIIWTGDEAIDYLINSKMTSARQQNIKTKINIEFPRHTNIRSIDLTVILGNLLDNALEATRVAKEEQRFINLTIRRINNMLIIKVENGFNEKPIVSGGELQTSKSDKYLHGWGVKSVLSATEKYDGTIETSCENRIFQAVATLSYQAVQ